MLGLVLALGFTGGGYFWGKRSGRKEGEHHIYHHDAPIDLAEYRRTHDGRR